jgi:16S rRNA (cytidine1402-2'-O)-methyltransferase
MLGTLYLVATPIGNLDDITFRAVEILKSVDLIACEDTRHSGKLLNHLKIKQKLISYHEHNEIERADELAKMLLQGKNIAVISDAGTPAICDPSFRITSKAIEIGANVISIPGAVAFVNAAIISGLPCDAIFFGGFLPSKKSERIARLNEVKSIKATLVFYESPHRLAGSLVDCYETLGNRKIAIVRELTKLHEEAIRGNLAEIASQNLSLKGEIVFVIDREEIEGSDNKDNDNKTLLERYTELETEFDSKIALKKAAKEFGMSKSEAYRMIQIKGVVQ